MKLNTNFRKNQHHSIRIVISAMYASAIFIILASAVLLENYHEVAANVDFLKSRALELKTERDAHANVFQSLGGDNEANNEIRSDLLSLFSKYHGRSPESLLYDIEKHSPQSLYLTNFTYDRLTGTGTVNAVVSKNEQISTMLETLEQTGNYSKVMLVSKSDIENKGSFKIVIRLEQEVGEDVNE